MRSKRLPAARCWSGGLVSFISLGIMPRHGFHDFVHALLYMV